MITAIYNGTEYKVDRLANRGEWFGETYIFGFGCGFDAFIVVAEGDNETEALNAIADSERFDHWLALLSPEDEAELIAEGNEDLISYIGNDGSPYDIEAIDIRFAGRCKVNYFVNPADWDRWADFRPAE